MNTTSTVRLVDRRRRIVEVDGPRPPEWRRPKLSFDSYVVDGQLPAEVAFCFKTGRTSRFFVNPGPAGDRLLVRVDKSPAVAEPYGEGWVVR